MVSAEKCAEQLRFGYRKTKKCLYERVIVPTELSGAEVRGLRSGG